MDIIDFVKFLLQNGADANAVCGENRMDSTASRSWESSTIAKVLIQNGADVNKPDCWKTDSTSIRNSV